MFTQVLGLLFNRHIYVGSFSNVAFLWVSQGPLLIEKLFLMP